MGKKGKTALLLTLVVVISCLTLVTVESANAQSIPEPSVPEFTAEYVDHSYDVPTTTTSYTDPHTGELTTQINQGHRVENFTIDVKIKNQVFPESIDGEVLAMEYTILTKGHFEEDGHYAKNIVTKSTSGYTTVTLRTDVYPAGGKVDIQVKAGLGQYYIDWKEAPAVRSPRASDWSNTHTVTIGESSSTSPTSTPKPFSQTDRNAPQNQLSDWIVILSPLILIAIAFGLIALLLYERHRKKAIP